MHVSLDKPLLNCKIQIAPVSWLLFNMQLACTGLYTHRRTSEGACNNVLRNVDSKIQTWCSMLFCTPFIVQHQAVERHKHSDLAFFAHARNYRSTNSVCLSLLAATFWPPTRNHIKQCCSNRAAIFEFRRLHYLHAPWSVGLIMGSWYTWIIPGAYKGKERSTAVYPNLNSAAVRGQILPY